MFLLKYMIEYYEAWALMEIIENLGHVSRHVLCLFENIFKNQSTLRTHMKSVPEVSEFNTTRQGFWRVEVS